nr:MAG TPA: hypothetical protein [Caudoviricetes sp.]
MVLISLNPFKINTLYYYLLPICYQQNYFFSLKKAR